MCRSVNPLAIALLLFLPQLLYGQETTAGIDGMVSGNQIPLEGAIVKAVHQPTRTSYATTTRKDGRYSLDNLKIGGPYTITVSFTGFEDEKKENIVLFLGQQFNADFSLNPQVKSLPHVTVKSQSQGNGHEDNPDPTDVLPYTVIQRSPTVDRSLIDYLKLTPGYSDNNYAGRSKYYNSITVDGASLDNAFGILSSSGTTIPGQPLTIESIEQIQVNISPFDVWQGGFSGAQINIATRSGTNNVTGSAYAYDNGIGTLGDRAGNTKVPIEDFEFKIRGFSVGGPIKKDKLFFFLSAENQILNSASTSFTASDSLHPPGGNVSLATADDLNKLRQFLIQRFSYDPGKFQDYDYQTKRNKLSVKIDWNINDNNKFTLKYNYSNVSRDFPSGNNGAPSGGRQAGPTSLPFSSSGYTNINNYNVLIAELNTRINNKASNKLQVGYTTVRNFRTSQANDNFPFVDILNGHGQSYTSFGYEPLSYNNLTNINLFQVLDIFRLNKGSHEISFGTQNYFKQFKTGFAPYYNGLYRFNSLSDFYNSVNNGAANASRYILQYTITKDGSFPCPEINTSELGFFAQDKWSVTDNFSFSYGLRLDVPVFHNKLISNPHVPSLVFRNGKQYDVSQNPGNNALVSPRIGFNWGVANDKKTQVRGGVGLFAGPPPFIWLSNLASNNGMQFGSLQKSRIAFSRFREKYLVDPVKENTSYNLALTTKDFKFPQALKATLAVDRKLPGNITATLEATYSKDISAVYFQNVNLPETGKALAGSDNRIRYDSSQIYGGHPVASPTNPNIDDAILMTNSSKGYGYAITLQLQKITGSFYFAAAYTYSKAKTINDGGYFQSNIWKARPVNGDPNAEELGYADFYMPHRIIAYGSYRKEYGKHFATSVGFVFEASPAGVGSYTYKGDLNNDGVSDNDLMYIPKDQDDIVLVPVSKNGGSYTDTRTADQIWAQLNSYINQDAYLSKHRGQTVQRNAVVFPFYNRLDLNIMQEFYLENKTSKLRHTLTVSFDIFNFSNLINKNWGSYKPFTSFSNYDPFTSSILQFEGIEGPEELNPGKPKFSFPYLDPANKIPLEKSYTDDASVLSLWQGQIGVRYTFR